MNARSNARSMMRAHEEDAMHIQTYRQTYEDASSPTGDNSPQVTRTRTYGEGFAQDELRRRMRGERSVASLSVLAAIHELAMDGLTPAEIAAQLGIHRDSVTRARRRMGIASPQPWTYVDDMAVERAVESGPSGRLTPAETREAVRILTARGLSGSFIARRLRVTERTVDRHRAALGGSARIRQEAS